MNSIMLVHTDNEKWNISPYRQWTVKYKSIQTMKSEILVHTDNEKWDRDEGTKKYITENWDWNIRNHRNYDWINIQKMYEYVWEGQ